MRRSLSLSCALAALCVSTTAFATTVEPNGTQVPLDSFAKTGEEQLYTLFTSRNDPVDWLADSHTTPDVFSPLCDFKATFVLHQAGANRGVGWYNVVPGATTAPTLSDIHVIVPAGTAVGTVITAATIKGDPAYAGGLVGFALVGGTEIHYSEQKWNVVYTLSSPPAPWVLAVIYQSKATPNAYYLAFEDGSVSAIGWSNDGDFNDDVFFFEGLTCQGGGTPCQTGLLGACADGLNECSATGLTCKQVVQPGTEKCDGIDNDCNGKTDDGNLCQTGFVCDHGTCVARCTPGEFACDTGLVCSVDGFCVVPACASVTCADGTVCVNGTCKAPCDGVACPIPTVCRAGLCVDPCAGVTCATGSVCDKGVCVTNCDCNPCGPGLACDTTSEKCMDPACVGVSCTAPQQCVPGAAGTDAATGTCVDPCVAAVCPTNQECKSGACVPKPIPDGGIGGSDSGVIFVPTGGTPAGAGGGTGANGGIGGASNGTGSTGAGVNSKGSKDAPGCGCRVSGDDSEDGRMAWGALALAATALVRGRRRGDRRRTFRC